MAELVEFDSRITRLLEEPSTITLSVWFISPITKVSEQPSRITINTEFNSRIGA